MSIPWQNSFTSTPLSAKKANATARLIMENTLRGKDGASKVESKNSDGTLLLLGRLGSQPWAVQVVFDTGELLDQP